MTPGTPVTVLRPDSPAHRHGTVVEPRGDAWPVWVEHGCDCWTPGTISAHVRGYVETELTTETVVAQEISPDSCDNGGGNDRRPGALTPSRPSHSDSPQRKEGVRT